MLSLRFSSTALHHHRTVLTDLVPFPSSQKKKIDFAEVPEVVAPVMFFLSAGSGMVNGSVMPVEGGLLGVCTLM